MCFLAEMLAVMVIWLSSLALGQFGVAIDKKPLLRQAPERIVPRSPRDAIQTPVTPAAREAPSPMA